MCVSVCVCERERMNNTMQDDYLEFPVLSLPHRYSLVWGCSVDSRLWNREKVNIDSWRQVGPVSNTRQLAKRKKKDAEGEHAASNNGTSHHLGGWLAVFPSFLDPYEFPALPFLSSPTYPCVVCPSSLRLFAETFSFFFSSNN